MIAGVIGVVVIAAAAAFLPTMNTNDVFIKRTFIVNMAVIEIVIVIAVTHWIKKSHCYSYGGCR